MDNKKPWLSKTIWLAVITAIAPFIPGGQAFISAHLAEVGIVWGVLATILRVISKDKISLQD